MLEEKNIGFEIDEDSIDFILQHGYDATYGARPLKRMIQKFIVNPLSTELLTNKYESGDIIIVSYPGAGKLEFNKR